MGHIRDRRSHLTRTQSREAAFIRRGWPAPGHLGLQVEGQQAVRIVRPRNELESEELVTTYIRRPAACSGEVQPRVDYQAANAPQAVIVLNHATVWRRPSSNGMVGS